MEASEPLRILARLEGAEAVASNLSSNILTPIEDAVVTGEVTAGIMADAVRFEIGRVVGTTPTPSVSFAPGRCDQISLGDGIVNETAAKILRGICEFLEELIREITLLFGDLFGRILNEIRAVVEDLIRRITEVVDRIVSALATALEVVLQKVREIVSTIVEEIRRLVDGIADIVRRILGEIPQLISSIMAAIENAVVTVVEKIRDGFRLLLQAGEELFNRIKGGVVAVIGALIDAAEFVFDRVGAALATLIEVLTGAAESGLARVREAVESIPMAVRELGEDVIEGAKEVVGAPLSLMGTLLITQVEAFFEKLIEDQNIDPEQIIRTFLQGVGITDEVGDRVASAAGAALPQTPVFFVMIAAVLVPFLLMPAVNALLGPAFEEIRQESAQRITPTLIPTADALEAFFRGGIDRDKLQKEMGEAGFSTERIDILLTSGRRLLGLGEVFRWWLREFITDEQLDAFLEMQRIAPEDRARLKEAIFFIPPAGDLIRMAVREVFSPEIRERFGQDEGFPEEFAKFGRQQGLSEEWARNFWAAHWALPSPRQGFEMLHRKVIDTDDLDLLLRALDVMPFWRDRLTQIAFKTITRVDLRRFHKLGLLTEEELQARYEALGFNADDAAKMVEFTIAFNKTEPTEDAAELEGLTRATVLNLFEDGVLSAEQAQITLLQLGHSEDAAALLIEQRALEIERADRGEQIGLILDQAGAGAITFDEAQDRLGQLGLEPAELQRALVKLQRARERQTTLPARADLDKMLGAGLIDEEKYVETMQRRGFTRFWAEAFLNLATE